jgi:hypothetical protein
MQKRQQEAKGSGLLLAQARKEKIEYWQEFFYIKNQKQT